MSGNDRDAAAGLPFLRHRESEDTALIAALQDQYRRREVDMGETHRVT